MALWQINPPSNDLPLTFINIVLDVIIIIVGIFHSIRMSIEILTVGKLVNFFRGKIFFIYSNHRLLMLSKNWGLFINCWKEGHSEDVDGNIITLSVNIRDVWNYENGQEMLATTLQNARYSISNSRLMMLWQKICLFCVYQLV